jgi:hypothetical protein
MKIAVSSGHGTKIRGARGNPVPPNLDEVDEAIKLKDQIVKYLIAAGVDAVGYTDTVSTTQSENLDRIVDWHNAQGAHDYDVSVHFNAYQQCDKPMGTEVLYVTQDLLASYLSEAIADAGDFLDRGPKRRTDLAFLNNTEAKSVLLEICFCDSTIDSALYKQNQDAIARAIAAVLSGEEIAELPDHPPPLETAPPPGEVLFSTAGKVSYFGGPDDTGVSASEGLAFFYDYEEAPHLFLPQQPPGTTGLARRLNPGIFYIACRWDYDVTSKTMLANPSRQALVRAGDREFLAWPADWGPHEDTDRVADLSPALMEALDLQTDDDVEVIYPAPQ